MKEVMIWPVLWYLRFLTKAAFLINRPKIIGIAGSIGKSSTRNAIFAVLKNYYKVKMVGNSETGIPLGILGITPKSYSTINWILMLFKAPFGIFNLKNIDYLIAEMGIDDPYPPKNMAYLLSILKPDIAISLNICGPHLMQFEKTLKDVKPEIIENPQKRLDYILDKMAEEDVKIITQSGCKEGIYNSDDPNIINKIEEFKKINSSTKLKSFGNNSSNQIFYKNYKIDEKGTIFEFLLKDEKDTIQIEIPNLLLPKAYEEVFSALILTALSCGLTTQQISNSLAKNFTLPKGRATVFNGINNSLIIDSSYNASTKSVLAFITLIETLKKKLNKPFVFLFGDMRELGEEAKEEHEKVAQKIIDSVDYLYCIGPLTKDYVLPFIKNQKNNLKEINWFQNAEKAGEYLKEKLPQDSLVLVKGSQNTIFLEEAIKYILKNKEDEKKLCRQEKFWMQMKKKFLT